MFRLNWGPNDNYPPPRRGQNTKPYKSRTASPNTKGGGGGSKPPSKGCGGKGPRTFALLVIVVGITQLIALIQIARVFI